MWTCPRDYRPDTNGHKHHCLFIYYLGWQQGRRPLPSLQTDSSTHKLFKKAERSGLTWLVGGLILKDKEELLKLWVFWRQEVAGSQKGDIVTCWRVNVVRLRRCFLRRNPSSKSPVEWLPKGAVPEVSKLGQSEHSSTPRSSRRAPAMHPHWETVACPLQTEPHLAKSVFLCSSFPLSHALSLSVPVISDFKLNYAYFIGWWQPYSPRQPSPLVKFGTLWVRKGHWLEMEPSSAFWLQLHLCTFSSSLLLLIL